MADDAAAPEQTQVPEQALRRLDALVGKWNTTWEVSVEPDGQIKYIYGTDSYEWLAGRHFLLHDTYARMGDYDYNVLEVIGDYDPDAQTYTSDIFDSQGNKSSMQVRVDGADVWMFSGEKQRSKLEVSADGTTITTTWERSDDGTTWKPWMVLHSTRIR